MSKLELYVVDTETTGLDPIKNDVIEISILRVGTNEHMTWYMKPTNPDNIETKALEVNGTNIDDLLGKTEAGRKKYRTPTEVLPEIENWLSDDNSNIYDRVLIGHNVGFDVKMLQNIWKKCNASDTYPFSPYGNEIDTKGLAFFFDVVNGGTKSDKYNLGACIKKYGLEKRASHNALDDVLSCRDLFLNFLKLAKNEKV